MSERSQNRTYRSQLADIINDRHEIEYSELESYVDSRYDHLQQKIRDSDMDNYEDQLHVVSWKGQQEELVKLLRHFEEK